MKAPLAMDSFDRLIAGAAAAPAGARKAAPEPRPRSEQVTSRILSLVKSGNLKAGDRLPTEQQMAIALGISRPTLREALKALAVLGIIERAGKAAATR